MATVKDYLPIDDAKHPIEKQVKPHPSTAELTTIISPGKPIPAKQFEKNKFKRKRKKNSTSNYIKDITKKDSILILTEKPQAAQKIAQALSSSNRKFTDNRASFFELTYNNDKIIVASAVGHLFNLTYSKGQTGWPVFKIEWIPAHTQKKAGFTKPYFNLLKKLSKKAKDVIVATDYDNEGEVIGWNVLRFIFNKATARRMKYSTLTKPELIKAYENPLKELDWGHAYAGETRHILDWLYGINLSRALMSAIKTSGSFKILSIGRVQGPALKIIVDRENEIFSFKSKPYWQVFALSNNTLFKHPKDIFDQSQLPIFKKITEAEAITNSTEEHITPPVPFDLTTLQREAYRHHGISPSQTLQTSQKLYLDGLISYPRTSSQKIPDSIEPKKILKALEKNFSQYTKLTTRSSPIEGKKSDPAHPSIFPTGEFKILEEHAFKLYNLIVKRFISTFAPDAITTNKRIKLTTNTQDPNNDKGKITFSASGLKVIKKGWTQIYPAKLEETTIEDLNGKVKIDEIIFEDKETQPPKRFTPTSLITILEKKNLGTKATRSMIVETLFNRGYLDGKSIKATPLGIKLIESLQKYSPIIIDENLTRLIEEEIEKMQENKSTDLKNKEKEIVQKAIKIITDISKEFKLKEIQIGKDLAEGLGEQRKQEQESNILVPCLSCKKGNLRIMYSRKTQRSFVACSAYPECTKTYNLPPQSLIKKSVKFCPDCNYPKLLSIKKGKRPWEFCFNPECTDNKKRREEWENKQKILKEKNL
jgi:DNA topoisomerase I